jgi:hypothetical protein
MYTAADNAANWNVKERPSTPIECVKGTECCYVSISAVLHCTGKTVSCCEGFIARVCPLLLLLLRAPSIE